MERDWETYGFRCKQIDLHAKKSFLQTLNYGCCTTFVLLVVYINWTVSRKAVFPPLHLRWQGMVKWHEIGVSCVGTCARHVSRLGGCFRAALSQHGKGPMCTLHITPYCPSLEMFRTTVNHPFQRTIKLSWSSKRALIYSIHVFISTFWCSIQRGAWQLVSCSSPFRDVWSLMWHYPKPRIRAPLFSRPSGEPEGVMYLMYLLMVWLDGSEIPRPTTWDV